MTRAWIRSRERSLAEANEEGEEAALVGVGEGFEVVEDVEGAGAGESVDEEARALAGGYLGDLGLLESAIEQGHGCCAR